MSAYLAVHIAIMTIFYPIPIFICAKYTDLFKWFNDCYSCARIETINLNKGDKK